VHRQLEKSRFLYVYYPTDLKAGNGTSEDGKGYEDASATPKSRHILRARNWLISRWRGMADVWLFSGL